MFQTLHEISKNFRKKKEEEDLIISAFTCKSMIHLELIFVFD